MKDRERGALAALKLMQTQLVAAVHVFTAFARETSKKVLFISTVAITINFACLGVETRQW